MATVKKLEKPDDPDTATRRRMLRKAIDDRYDGVSAAFARAVGKPDRQINDMLGKRKSFGARVAREMEAKAGLPRFYFENLFTWPFDIDYRRIEVLAEGDLRELQGALRMALAEIERSKANEGAA